MNVSCAVYSEIRWFAMAAQVTRFDHAGLLSMGLFEGSCVRESTTNSGGPQGQHKARNVNENHEIVLKRARYCIVVGGGYLVDIIFCHRWNINSKLPINVFNELNLSYLNWCHNYSYYKSGHAFCATSVRKKNAPASKNPSWKTGTCHS